METETHQFSRKKISADKAHGGANKVAKSSTKAVAPTVPKVLYIANVNNESANPKWYLKKLLPESTKAAMDRQAVTRYVRVDRLGKAKSHSEKN